MFKAIKGDKYEKGQFINRIILIEYVFEYF